MSKNKALSPKQLEILILKSQGLSKKQIAAHYDIADRTVRFHLDEINQKITESSPIDSYAFFLIKNDIELLESTVQKFGYEVLKSDVVKTYFTTISYNKVRFEELSNRKEVAYA